MVDISEEAQTFAQLRQSGELGQVTLFTTPVQAVHAHESKFLVFSSAEVDLSPLNPIAIAEIVQTDRNLGFLPRHPC